MMKKIIFSLVFTSFCLLAGDKVQPKPLEKVVNTEDIQDTKAKSSIGEWINETFGLTPYRPNYLLPLSYTKYNYKVYTPTDGKYKNYEVELQISFKVAFGENLLGLHEIYYGAYTQRSFWQLYIDSAPFREINYNPEFFVIIPWGSKEYFGLKSFEFGYSHVSNGQGNIKETNNAEKYPEIENRSRSINRLYAKVVIQQNAFIMKAQLWYPIGRLDDNEDIMHYLGYGQIDMMYFYKKHLFTFMGRASIVHQKGAMELTYSHPGKLKGVYFFAKIFSGYGESLIDYDNRLTKYSVGFSFSR